VRALLLAAFACANPSPLDSVDRVDVDKLAPWTTIAARARPFDTGREQLDAMLTTKDPAQQKAALIAWARAGGRWFRLPQVRPIGAGGSDDDVIAYAMITTELVKAHPDDDTLVEAGLYLAQRMRREGNDILTAIGAIALQRGIIAARPQAPSFAARYAPSDQEAIRAFEAEAMAVSRTVAFGRDGNGVRTETMVDSTDLAQWAWLADAPTERDAFVRAIKARGSSHPDEVATSFPMYTDKLFGAVDDYRAWLERAGQADPAAARDHDRR
jgi:hypothetical protein